MAPGYRPNNNRRQTRTGYVNHDVFEGLPVRHWHRDYVMVAPPPPSQDSPVLQNDVWAVELPYGMPKDSHLLAQHSQDLLRAARSGRIYKRSVPPEEEEVDADTILGDKTDKKEDDPKNTGFIARAWKLIPRYLEGPDVEYLAKQRKGVITATKKSASSAPTVMTKATVKRMDAAGNEYVQDIVVPQGHPVDGEVLVQRVIQDPNASALGDGSVVSLKRKIPPPRKKSKGTGKSKKKKPNTPSSIPQAGGVSSSANGTGVEMDKNDGEIEIENSTPSKDAEIADESMETSDDDEGNEGEEGEAGNEEEGDEEAPADQSTSPKPPKPLEPLLPVPINAPVTEDTPSINESGTSVSDVMPPTQPASENIDEKADENAEATVKSPLENTALTTSTLSPPDKSPELTSSPGKALESTETAIVDEATQQDVVETAPISPSPPPSESANTETKPVKEV